MFTKLKKMFFTGRQKSFPDFMIIGAQKAGSTALYDYLSQHPEIQATEEKELHYFNCDFRYNQGREFYQSLFQRDDTKSKLLFDASPGYLHNPNAPKRIYEHNPHIKIIILLRDPVERAYSAWNMYNKRYLNNRNWFFEEWVSFCGSSGFTILRRKDAHLFNFFQYITDEIELQNTNESTVLEASVISHGYYCEQIKRYFSLFNKDQILIIENSEMRMDTIKCLRNIETFLGISNCDWKSKNLTPVFEGEYSEPIEPVAKHFLYDYYAPSNESLFGLIGKNYQWGEAE